jgi:glucose-6-phosphate isomerase
VLWGINAFDQWGVELGKKLADALVPAVEKPGAVGELDAGIAHLLAYVMKWRA